MRRDFSVYISEYQAEGIGDLMYSFICDTVEKVTRRYPSAVYSPNGIWDEDAISGLCNDFIMEKLLKAGWLEHYLQSLETEDQFRYVLQRDFKHFLINRRKKDEFQNLVRRLHHLLTTNGTFKFLSSAHNTWGLDEWGTTDVAQDLDDVINAMFTISLLPLTRYSANSRKVSHLISNEDLERLIKGTLRELNRTVDFGLLVQALRYRLNLLDIESVSLEEPIDWNSTESATYAEIISAPVSSGIELVEIAHRIYGQLTSRQRRTLSTYMTLEKPTLDRIGTALGISKSAVGNELTAVKAYIASAELSDEEAEKLLTYLFELCSEEVQ